MALPGCFPIYDLADVGIDLPAGDYATVAGFVVDRLGRIPAVGDVLTSGASNIEVRDVKRNRITELALKPFAPEPHTREVSEDATFADT